MIRYALHCEAGHDFESWFRDSEAYEVQAEAGHLACPHCGSSAIEKRLMAPAVALKADKPVPVAMMGEKEREMREFLRAFRKQLEEKAENVGEGFVEEARKIHYGETEERAIYGVATPREAQALNEEGIEVLPVPSMPDEMN
jgi:hypothetical protein